jgi:hypothetical protein
MRVLVIEGTPGAARSAVKALHAAGHQTTSCHDEGSTFPCHGLGGGSGCPLDQVGGIDVAMLVREVASAQPTPSEDGLRCALRRHIPLALVGAMDDNPYARFAAAAANGVTDVVQLAEAALASPLAAHAGVARLALTKVLEGEGLDASKADAIVTRSGATLSVVLSPGVAIDSRVIEVASVRALAAVRSHDRSATIIDVAIAPATALPA